MRVAHIVGVFLPKSETFIYTELVAQADLAQLVVARRTENLDLYPFDSLWELDKVSRALGGIARRLPGRMDGLDPFPRRLTRAVGAFRADLLHARFGWGGAHAVRTARQLKLPLVVTFYGRDVYSPRMQPGIPPGLYDDVFEVGDMFFCVGPRLGDELVRAGATRERVHVVPIGLRLDLFPFAPAPADPGKLILLHVGRLVDKKGTDTAVRAFAAVRTHLPHAELWIAGDGPQREALEQLARELGVESAITFHGALPNAQVRELMAKAHFGVQPSRIATDGDQEGTPTVLIEMQARGVDVVATQHADIPFIVPDPDRLVPENDFEALAEEILMRIGEPAMVRKQRLVAGRALVEQQHDAVGVAKLVRSLYDEAGTQNASRG